MQSLRHDREAGASLVIVLIVISVFGLVLSGLLTEAGVSVRYTNAVSAHQDKVYAADAGVQAAIEQLRENSSVCDGRSVSGPALATMDIASHEVTITCSSVSGSTFNAEHFAVIATGTGPSTLHASNARNKVISGGIYSSGQMSGGGGSGFTLSNGNAWERAGTGAHNCKVGDPPPSTLTLEPPGEYTCTTLAPPEVPNAPPPRPTVTQTANPAEISAGCKRFLPGRYASAPVLSSRNYFASGVYYFDFSGTFLVNSAVVAGQPGPGETRILNGPCASDPAGSTGTGALFVFGGASRLVVGNGGSLEIFARTGDVATATPGMSFVAVPPTGWTGWNANTVGPVAQLPVSGSTESGVVLNGANGDTTNMAIHGRVFAPGRTVRVRATSTVWAQALGGLVVHNAEIESTGSAVNLAVSKKVGPPEPIEVRVVAEAKSTSPGDKAVRSSAVLAVNSTTGLVNVKSWRTQGTTD